MPDQTIRYNFTASTAQAQSAIREMSKALQDQRETFKQSIYTERSRRAEVISQIKQQEVGILKLEKAEQKQAREKLRLLKAEEAALGAKNKAAIAGEQSRLRLLERKEVGVTGLDRMSVPGGLLPGFGRLAQLGGINIPAPLSAIAQSFSGGTGGRVSGNLIPQARAASLALEGVGGAAAGLSAALGTAGLIGVFFAATAAANEFGRQFDEASKRQTQSIVTTGQIVNAIGGDRSNARGLVDQFNRSLSKESGGLVNTADSGAIGRGILDDILAGAKQSGRSNRDAVGQAARISTGLAGLASATGTDTSQLDNVLSDISSRSQSVDQLRGRDVLNDLGINKILIPELEKRGIKKLSELTQDQVFGLLESAVTKSFSSDTRSELEGTTQGIFAKLKYKFFDPFEGVLSIERELPGGGSVFSEASRTLKLIFGTGGTFEQLSKAFGGSSDPMIALRDSIASFNSLLEEINKVLAVTANASDFVQRNTKFNVGGLNVDLTKLVMDTLKAPLGFSLSNFGFGFGEAKPKYAGTAAAGFMPLGSAIASEVANKPSGSNLIVANSSEFVYRPDQLSSLLTRTSQSASTVLQIASGAITIVQQPREDSNQLADRVLSRLDQLVKNERNYRLA
jgi:hypothetical protein